MKTPEAPKNVVHLAARGPAQNLDRPPPGATLEKLQAAIAYIRATEALDLARRACAAVGVSV